MACNGILAGLAAITAPGAFVDSAGAVLIGATIAALSLAATIAAVITLRPGTRPPGLLRASSKQTLRPPSQ